MIIIDIGYREDSI